MDNETSKDVEDFIKSQQTTLQYTPLDIHRGSQDVEEPLHCRHRKPA
jgi:hypothetical protein